MDSARYIIGPDPDRLTARQRIEEIGKILDAGLRRARAKGTLPVAAPVQQQHPKRARARRRNR